MLVVMELLFQPHYLVIPLLYPSIVQRIAKVVRGSSLSIEDLALESFNRIKQ